MPLYEFVCQKCGREQELLVRGKEVPDCQSCGSIELTKLLSVPAAPTAAGQSELPPQGSCGSGCGCFPG